MNSTVHPQVDRYLQQFDAESAAIPHARRVSLREEIEAHLRDAVPAGASERDAAAAIADFGAPAEIIGQETGASTRPRPTGLITLIGGIAATLALAAALVVSVSVNSQPKSIVIKNPIGVERTSEGQAYFEYLAAIEELPPLPTGAEYPGGVPLGLDAGPIETEPGGIMESGAGRVIAHFTWLCAWESEYLSAFDADDAKRIVTAEARFKEFAKTSFYEDWSPEGSWYRVVVMPLTLGDPSGAKTDRAQSCFQAGITFPRD